MYSYVNSNYLNLGQLLAIATFPLWALTMLKRFYCVDHNKLWKILKEMGIPDHLTCLLSSLYADQEATVRTSYGTTDGSQIGKGARQVCILSPGLYNLHSEYVM